MITEWGKDGMLGRVTEHVDYVHVCTSEYNRRHSYVSWRAGSVVSHCFDQPKE